MLFYSFNFTNVIGNFTFRIVTALAPPFVMEGALDEDGQCLRGVICHRVLNSDKDNLTLVFNEMETQERMEDEVEELGIKIHPLCQIFQMSIYIYN